MKTLPILLLLAGAVTAVADAPSFALWTHASAAQTVTELAAKLNAGGTATQKLADMGNFNFGRTLRRKNGGAEVHLKVADIFIIESGEADLVTGGAVVDSKNSSPTEIRGTSIKDGVTRHVVPGDILTIPAGMPHQMMVPGGKEVLYMAIKVVQ